jgi:hypothetical protein
VDTLSFTTPAKNRPDQAVPVQLCGEEFSVRKPKDAVLYFTQTAIGETVSEGDRAMAILQFVDSALSPVDRKRFFDRCMDGPRGADRPGDPVNQATTLEMIGGLLDRWSNWPEHGTHTPEPVLVEPRVTAVHGGPVHVQHPDLDLDFVAYPPKDVILLFVSASLATGASTGQQAWAIGLFLDSALDKPDSLLVSTRLRHTDDDLDLGHLAEIVNALITQWRPVNRAARRAAQRVAVAE